MQQIIPFADIDGGTEFINSHYNGVVAEYQTEIEAIAYAWSIINGHRFIKLHFLMPEIISVGISVIYDDED